ncbi:hypothetical protein D3C86_1265460 [compost metagenome]
MTPVQFSAWCNVPYCPLRICRNSTLSDIALAINRPISPLSNGDIITGRSYISKDDWNIVRLRNPMHTNLIRAGSNRQLTNIECCICLLMIILWLVMIVIIIRDHCWLSRQQVTIPTRSTNSRLLGFHV